MSLVSNFFLVATFLQFTNFNEDHLRVWAVGGESNLEFR